jgi:hypothetical protein
MVSHMHKHRADLGNQITLKRGDYHRRKSEPNTVMSEVWEPIVHKVLFLQSVYFYFE